MIRANVSPQSRQIGQALLQHNAQQMSLPAMMQQPQQMAGGMPVQKPYAQMQGMHQAQQMQPQQMQDPQAQSLAALLARFQR